jgi:hypothetical protein
MPAHLYLHHFGRLVHDAFGWCPYFVGSATNSKAWRDIDVRLILPDDDYERLIGPWAPVYERNPAWCAHVLAWSALGQAMTGLPIDFQIQQRTDANERFKGPRHALGIVGAPGDWRGWEQHLDAIAAARGGHGEGERP